MRRIADVWWLDDKIHESENHKNQFAPFGSRFKRMFIDESRQSPANDQSVDSPGHITAGCYQNHETARL
jgi:hypothetical protein